MKILLVLSFNVGNRLLCVLFVFITQESTEKPQSGLWTNVVVVVQHEVLLAAGGGRSDIRQCIWRLFDQCLPICSTHAFHVAINTVSIKKNSLMYSMNSR